MNENTLRPDFQLSDIDTAFPREDSSAVLLRFEDGTAEPITTNLNEEEFRAMFSGKLVERCYYGRRDEWTKTARITEIKFHRVPAPRCTDSPQVDPEVLEQALRSRTFSFSLSDQRVYALEQALAARAIQYVETSQDGSDITLYLDGHPKYAQKARPPMPPLPSASPPAAGRTTSK